MDAALKTRMVTHFEGLVMSTPDLVEQFYGILFERYPQVKPLFGVRSQESQAKMLGEMLVTLMDRLDEQEWVRETLLAAGRRHEGYEVTAQMYPWVGECLIEAMRRNAEEWDDALEQGWVSLYGVITELMLEGHALARAEVD